MHHHRDCGNLLCQAGPGALLLARLDELTQLVLVAQRCGEWPGKRATSLAMVARGGSVLALNDSEQATWLMKRGTMSS